MSNDVLEVLAKFQIDVAHGFATLREEFRTELSSFRNETLNHFDAIYKRFDVLSDDFVAMKGGMKRLEERMDTLEKPT